MNWLPHALCLVFFAQIIAQAQLNRAIDIRTLSYEHSLEKLPVDLTATVGFVEGSSTVFVQDATAGTHLHFKPGRADLRVGDLVRVKGITTAGLYFPGVDVAELQILGHEAPPVAEPATYEDLASGRFHYQRVLVEGLGRTLTRLDENRSLLRLAMDSRVIEVRVDSPPESAPDVVDARLRITALAAGGINDRRQLVFPYLRVTDWNDIAITQSAGTPKSLPVTSVATFLRFGVADEARHRVRIRGAVLAAFHDGRIFLRDSTPAPPPREKPKDETTRPPQSPSVAIRLTTPSNLTPGHLAEITGFPVMDGFSASLADALVLSTNTAALPPATNVSLKEFQDGSHDADLVRLSTPVVLNDFFRTSDGFELSFTCSGISIRAFLPQDSQPSLETGSSCRLTGICLVEASTDKGFHSQAERASLLLRTTDDIQVLSTAPFWDARRFIIAIAILGCVILLTLFWITQQRRQITRLERRVARQATLDERQRIAREFHDTLEQELTGLSLRLDAATTRPLEDKARSLLETSRSLVSRIQSEARNLVSDLRDTGHTATLSEALHILASRAPEGIAIKLDISPAPPIPPHVTHHLRMIAQEAVTNALKHACASEVTLHLSSTPTLLTLRITDNGRGFAAGTETLGKPGHFGCVGIRERVRKIGAGAEWQSSAGKGTSVIVTLPLTST
ncbi:MAG: sensor histidine kinase [Verrucomicrobiaceae bacterium]|nr:sensor histidine kinase [Verrucomicrobiaceae bacterium]